MHRTFLHKPQNPPPEPDAHPHLCAIFITRWRNDEPAQNQNKGEHVTEIFQTGGGGWGGCQELQSGVRTLVRRKSLQRQQKWVTITPEPEPPNTRSQMTSASNVGHARRGRGHAEGATKVSENTHEVAECGPKDAASHLKPGGSDRDVGHVLIRLAPAVWEPRLQTTHFGSPNGANQCEMSGSGGRMSHTIRPEPTQNREHFTGPAVGPARVTQSTSKRRVKKKKKKVQSLSPLTQFGPSYPLTQV